MNAKEIKTINLLERADILEYIENLSVEVAMNIANKQTFFLRKDINDVCAKDLVEEYAMYFCDKERELLDELSKFYSHLGYRSWSYVNEAIKAVESKIEDSIMEIIEAIKNANK